MLSKDCNTNLIKELIPLKTSTPAPLSLRDEILRVNLNDPTHREFITNAHLR